MIVADGLAVLDVPNLHITITNLLSILKEQGIRRSRSSNQIGNRIEFTEGDLLLMTLQSDYRSINILRKSSFREFPKLFEIRRKEPRNTFKVQSTEEERIISSSKGLKSKSKTSPLLN